ncbi:HAD-IIB family hydrolase [Patescibacteria group bacterium]|nr:HAD-IIB family hydrolase [Patescibacteria group bacterium]
MDIYRRKKIIVFDLDGTLAKSKSDIDDEISELIGGLLEVKKVALISGGAYPQIEKSFIKKLNIEKELLSNLFIFPTDATSFYKYEEGGWKNIYSEELTFDERKKIIEIFNGALNEAGYKKPEVVYGEIIEDRGTQITFSGLGQKAPLEDKLKWDPERKLREKIIDIFNEKGLNFEAKIGGSTSVDINKKGISKAYGIKKIQEKLEVSGDEILFIGDALFEGGNDHSVIGTGVDTIAVKNPEDTKKYIREIISSAL